MIIAEIIKLLIRSNSLKRIQRSGWITAGVHDKEYESVAAHSWGTCLISLIIAKQLADEGYEIDQGLVMEMATIHDLPEIVITDIPYSAIEIVGQELQTTKENSEKKAIEAIFAPIGKIGDKIVEIWKKTSNNEPIESRIVVGADIIDMLVHAISLERNGISPRILDSFFSKSYEKIDALNIPLIKEMYNALLKEHNLVFERLHQGED